MSKLKVRLAGGAGVVAGTSAVSLPIKTDAQRVAKQTRLRRRLAREGNCRPSPYYRCSLALQKALQNASLLSGLWQLDLAK